MTTEVRAEIFSFGFKYGPPREVNLLWDLRFLPNPYWVEGLRNRTGLDPAVSKYVLQSPEGIEFFRYIEPLLLFLVRQYRDSGKELRIAIGCTGGRHRSVAVTERLAALTLAAGFTIAVSHRDIDRDTG
jgi:RNase adaptor protein for sRNA GlmZ degradation